MDGYEGYEPHSHYTPNAGYESGSSDYYYWHTTTNEVRWWWT